MLRKLFSLLLLAACFGHAVASAQDVRCGLLPVMQDGKYGYIDRTGRLVIAARFDYASDFVGGMARVRVGDVWTYVSPGGEVMKTTFPKPFLFAEPEYDFSEGLAVYREGGETKYDGTRYREYVAGGRYGFIDRSGKVVIEARYAAAGPFREGLAAAADGEAYGYINKAGKFVVKPAFQRAEAFSEGLAYVEVKDGPKGYINKKGDWAVKLEERITSAGPFRNGLVRVEAGYKQGYVNRKGEYVVRPEYGWLGEFSEGLVAFRLDAEGGRAKFGYLDAAGKVVIEPKFDAAKNFSGGLASVQVGRDFSPDKRVGYIDRTGNFAVEPRFSYAEDFSEGLALVTTLPAAGRTESGYIDTAGRMVFKDVLGGRRFCGGLAWVKLPGGYTGYADKTGKVVWRQKQE